MIFFGPYLIEQIIFISFPLTYACYFLISATTAQLLDNVVSKSQTKHNEAMMENYSENALHILADLLEKKFIRSSKPQYHWLSAMLKGMYFYLLTYLFTFFL